MVEVFVGQKGKAVIKMHDAQGRETNTYDTITGIQYTVDNPELVSVVDEDAEPKDAELEALAPGTTNIGCQFDGDPGDGVRTIMLESEDIIVSEPPPGEAVSGIFEVTFTEVEPQA